MAFCLLPEPTTIRRAIGTYHPPNPIPIFVSTEAERGEWVAAHQLRDAFVLRGHRANVQLRSQPITSRGAIVLASSNRDVQVFPDVAPFPGDTLPNPDDYYLTIETDRITVVGACPEGAAQGVRTLIQLLQTTDSLPCLTIEDECMLITRGIMLDISRGKVPTLSTLRDIVDVIASFKLNQLQLYMENTFAFRSHPEIGEGWGALTADDIVELDDYCRDRYVELVPCFQSLGHHRRLLSLPQYKHLAYSPEDWTLTPGEETWKLLGELYDDLLPCFTSSYVNVCCDEPFDLTHTSPTDYDRAVLQAEPSPPSIPPSQDETFRQGADLFVSHMNRLHEMLRSRNKTMLMWDDIFQQAPELLSRIPVDIFLLSWFYEAVAEYPQPAISRQAKHPAYVCPGTSSWNTLWARHANARGNIRGFIRAGLREEYSSVLTTDWGDGGHPNFLGASWYGYAYTGAEAWSPERLTDDEFERRFARLFFGDARGPAAQEALTLLSSACELPGINKINGSCTRGMFFRNPVIDEATSLAADEAIEQMWTLATRALDLLTPLAGIDTNRTRTLAEMRFAARQIIHAAQKTQAGRRLARLTPHDDEEKHALYTEISKLKRELHEFRREYEQLWLARNKPEGIWLSLDLFDNAAHVLDSWRSQVAPAYLHGQ